jgi:hypothetical protein
MQPATPATENATYRFIAAQYATRGFQGRISTVESYRGFNLAINKILFASDISGLVSSFLMTLLFYRRQLQEHNEEEYGNNYENNSG